MKKNKRNIVAAIICIAVFFAALCPGLYLAKDRILIEANVIKYEYKYKKDESIENLENLAYYLSNSINAEKRCKYFKILIDSEELDEAFSTKKMEQALQSHGGVKTPKDYLLFFYLYDLLFEKEYEQYITEFKAYFPAFSDYGVRPVFFDGLCHAYAIAKDINVYYTFMEGYSQMLQASEDPDIQKECEIVLRVTKKVLSSKDSNLEVPEYTGQYYSEVLEKTDNSQ